MSFLRVDYPQRSLNIRTYLEDNGFTDFDTNEDYKKKSGAATLRWELKAITRASKRAGPKS